MKKGQEWHDWQLDYIREHYPNERAEDVGKAIGKSKLSVQHKANRLGLNKDKIGFKPVRTMATSGIHSGNFKGYRRVSKHGYILLYKPDHPSSSKYGVVMEHRYVVENALGITLPKEFDVHHINGDKTDNRIDNLAVVTHSAHSIMHNKGKERLLKGEKHPNYKQIDKELLIKLRNNGNSINQISKIMKFGREKIRNELRRLKDE